MVGGRGEGGGWKEWREEGGEERGWREKRWRVGRRMQRVERGRGGGVQKIEREEVGGGGEKVEKGKGGRGEDGGKRDTSKNIIPMLELSMVVSRTTLTNLPGFPPLSFQL